MGILQLALYFLLPVVIELVGKKFSIIHKVGVVTICYIAGLILANLSFIDIDKEIAQYIIEGTVALAIPLLLFKTDFQLIRSAGKPITIAFVCAVIAIVLASSITTLAYGDRLEDGWILGGMITGVYTGGTLNMSAIGVALNADENAFVMLNAADLLFGGILLLFFLTIASRVFGLFLRTNALRDSEASKNIISDDLKLKDSALALLLTIVIVVLAVGIAFLLTGGMDTVIILLSITTLGLAGSSIKTIHRLNGSYLMGNYLLYVFCIAVGSLANISEIVATGPLILGYVGITIGLMMVIYSVLVYAAKVDVDSAIIASVAGLYGPAFIPPVARATGAMYLVPLGIAFSLVGFAVGNYLGIAVARFLESLLF